MEEVMKRISAGQVPDWAFRIPNGMARNVPAGRIPSGRQPIGAQARNAGTER